MLLAIKVTSAQHIDPQADEKKEGYLNFSSLELTTLSKDFPAEQELPNEGEYKVTYLDLSNNKIEFFDWNDLFTILAERYPHMDTVFLGGNPVESSMGLKESESRAAWCNGVLTKFSVSTKILETACSGENIKG